jgi:hypothetical protein
VTGADFVSLGNEFDSNNVSDGDERCRTIPLIMLWIPAVAALHLATGQHAAPPINYWVSLPTVGGHVPLVMNWSSGEIRNLMTKRSVVPKNLYVASEVFYNFDTHSNMALVGTRGQYLLFNPALSKHRMLKHEFVRFYKGQIATLDRQGEHHYVISSNRRVHKRAIQGQILALSSDASSYLTCDQGDKGAIYSIWRFTRDFHPRKVSTFSYDDFMGSGFIEEVNPGKYIVGISDSSMGGSILFLDTSGAQLKQAPLGSYTTMFGSILPYRIGSSVWRIDQGGLVEATNKKLAVFTDRWVEYYDVRALGLKAISHNSDGAPVTTCFINGRLMKSHPKGTGKVLIDMSRSSNLRDRQ